MEKIIYKDKEISPYESFYWNTTREFFRGQLGGGISRTVKTDDSLATLVMKEIKIIKEGNCHSSGHNASSIVNTEGLAPTVMENHGTETAIKEEILIASMRGRNPDNPSERGKSNGNYKQRLEINKNGTTNTLTSVQKDNLVVESQVLTPKRTEYGKAVRKQYEAHDIKMSRHDMTTMTPRTDGVCNTLTSVQKDNLVAEPMCSVHPNSHKFEFNPETSIKPISPALRATDYKAPYCVYEPQVRIRKLTPRECFRLMDVSEEDIDKIQASGVSNSQQYKMAGNSIVVSCLFHIFRTLFIEKENPDLQMTIFDIL